MASAPLIHPTDKGLFCPAANAYIDPWKPVPRALITHGHADHARPGSDCYLTAAPGVPILERRLGAGARVDGVAYGETLRLGDAEVSFHPAGHILGSAQIRVAAGGEVWVVTGDFKRDPDPTCAPFEVVPCDVLITEATFGLPIYRWPNTADVVADLYRWWQANAAAGRATVVFAYALGKAQRLLAELLPHTGQAVLTHGAVEALTKLYRRAGVRMLPTEPVPTDRKTKPQEFVGRLIIAPPGANGTPWMKRFGDCATGFCSGWMRVRGQLQRRGYDRGFVISDHADWDGLVRTVQDCGARRVYATHGNTNPIVRYLNENGVHAEALETLYGQPEEEG